MIETPFSIEEEQRLIELQNCNLLDTAEEPEFDFISKLAAEKCNAKFAAVSLIDKDRQWSKAYYGLPVREAPRDVSFCSYAIKHPHQTMVVENASNDSRFKENPLVLNAPHIQFYVGVPLITENGMAIGTLCVLNDAPKKITAEELEFLQQLAKQTMALINLRRSTIALKQTTEHTTRVFQQLPGAAFRSSAESPRNWKYASSKISELTGYTGNELFSNPLLSIDHLILVEDRRKVRQQVQQNINSGTDWEIQYRIRHKNGNTRWILERAGLTKDGSSQNFIDGLLIDIEEQRSLEDLLFHAGEKTKQNEQLYRSVFSVLSEGLVVQDMTDRIIACNDAATEILGLTYEQLIGRDSYDSRWRVTNFDGSALHPEQHPSMVTLRTGRSVTDFLMRVYSGQQVYKTISVNARPILDDNGNLTGSVTSFSDITEKINSKKALEASEQKYTELFERMPNGYYRTTHKGQLLDANIAFVKMLGYDSLQELQNIDIPATLYLTSNEREDIRLNSEFNQDMETYRLRKKDGTIIWVEDHARYTSNEFGEVLFHEGICRDVTDKVRREQLNQLNLQLKSRPDNTLELPAFFDNVLLKLLQLTESEFGFIGEVKQENKENPFLKLYAVSNIAWNEESRAFHANNAPKGFEFTNLETLFGYSLKSKNLVISNAPKHDSRGAGLPQDHPELKAFIGIPIKNNNDEMVGLIGMANKVGGYATKDIEFLTPFIDSLAIVIEHAKSERKRVEAEVELQIKFEQLTATLETTPSVAIQWFDESGKVLYWNHSSEILYGYSKEEAVGKNLCELIINEEENIEFLHTLQIVKTTQSPFGPYEATAKRKDGTLCWVWATVFAIPLSNGKVGYVCMDIDISDRKRAEEILREQMIYNESLIAAIPDLLFVVNKTGNLIEWKAGNTNDLFVEPEKFINRNIYEFLPSELANEIMAGISQALESGKNVNLEYNVPLHETTTYFDAVISKFGNDKVIFLARNITDRKEAQLALQQSKFKALMASISTDFIKVGYEQKNSVIQDALAKCAQFFEADQCVLFENSEDNTFFLPTYKWSLDNTSDKMYHPIPAERISRILGGTILNAVINLPSIDSIPEAAVDRRNDWMKHNIKSTLSVTFKTSENYSGMLTLICTKDVHFWTKDEEESLRLITNIFTDALSRFRLEETLVEAKTKAEQANKIKTEFLANMSHEIRTPMNAILGFAELLKGKTTENKYENYLEGILTGGNALMSLIDDILDLSKIEAGALKISESAVDLDQLLKDQYNIFSPKAKEKGLFLNYFIEPDIPSTLFLDEIRFKQILFNLIGNAIKFTHSGYVAVAIELLPSSADNTVDIKLSVRDTGIGIPENQFSAIFEPFRQMDGQSARTYGGTGLGLSITKRLASIMGGELMVESKPGEGSVFTVLLKKIKPAVKNYRTPAVKLLPNPCFENQTILVVEDVESNRIVLRGLLEPYNLNIVETENGLDALNCIEEIKPDLIFLDLMMPVMDGHETAERIRKHSNLKIAQTPIVILSATAQSETNILELANAFLRKPTSREELLEVLLRYLEEVPKKLTI